MIRQILRYFGIWPYVKYAKLRYFPSPQQTDEEKRLDERKKFYSQFIKPGELCFDVGANIGNRSKVFLSMGCNVVAVEPQSECVKILNLRFGKKIRLVKSALGRSKGTALIYISDTSEISSLSSDWINAVSKSRFVGKKWDKQSKIDVTTLDSVITKYGLPAFCKIDVEGVEEDVIMGLSTAIPVISIEYTAPERIDNLRECLNRFSSLGIFVTNYTLGERMSLEETSWISASELIEKIEQKSTAGMYGDVYVR
ncbi:MAG: FkbM family methyltransferase, partial [Chryseolinea sp.]